jgi:uncharacterized HAD superfamily protein
VRPDKKKVLKIGVDFDGVVAYNPFRIIRAPIKWFKREVLGINKLTFFVPKTWWQKVMWIMIHESSIFPAQGTSLLRQLVGSDQVEVHLITARFGFLTGNLERWLEKNKMKKLFKTININKKCEQPHIYKERILRKLKLDVYVEDNLDIVLHLSKNKNIKTKIFWIYNILDATKNYAYKFPYLEKALLQITNENTF